MRVREGLHIRGQLLRMIVLERALQARMDVSRTLRCAQLTSFAYNCIVLLAIVLDGRDSKLVMAMLFQERLSLGEQSVLGHGARRGTHNPLYIMQYILQLARWCFQQHRQAERGRIAARVVAHRRVRQPEVEVGTETIDTWRSCVSFAAHHGARCAMNLDSLPPFTTVWVVGAVSLIILEKLDFVSQYQLFYSSYLTFHMRQYWRVLTTFLYFGSIDMSSLFHLFMAMRYSYMLEVQAYGASRRAEYAWILLIASIMLLLASSVVHMPFLSDGLSYVLMYLWSRKNRHIRMAFFGLLVFTAPYQPFVYTAMNWALRGFKLDILDEVAGLCIGHLSTLCD